MPVRSRVIVRRSNNSRQEGALRQGQLPQVFSEIGDAGLCETPDAKTSPISQVHFIRVHFENLLLVETLLQLKRKHGLGQLSPPVAICRKEEGSCHLHRDRAGALQVGAVAQVIPGRAEDADKVETRMLEEAFVFGGKNCVHQSWRQVFVTNRPALLPRAVKKVGNKFRLNLRGAQLRPTAQ